MFKLLYKEKKILEIDHCSLLTTRRLIYCCIYKIYHSFGFLWSFKFSNAFFFKDLRLFAESRGMGEDGAES